MSLSFESGWVLYRVPEGVNGQSQSQTELRCRLTTGFDLDVKVLRKITFLSRELGSSCNIPSRSITSSVRRLYNCQVRHGYLILHILISVLLPRSILSVDILYTTNSRGHSFLRRGTLTFVNTCQVDYFLKNIFGVSLLLPQENSVIYKTVCDVWDSPWQCRPKTDAVKKKSSVPYLIFKIYLLRIRIFFVILVWSWLTEKKNMCTFLKLLLFDMGTIYVS